MLYICSVYSIHAKSNSQKDRELREKRYQYAMKRTGELIQKGYHVFSPITHCHVISNQYDLPKDYAYWKENDRNFISASEGLFVLMMPHWEQSVGITDEIACAKSLGLPIIYLDCSDYSEEIDGVIYDGKDFATHRTL